MESWELDLPDFEVPTFESPKAKRDANPKQQGRRRSLRLLKRQSTDTGGELPGLGLGTYYDENAAIVPPKIQRRRSSNRRSRAKVPLDIPIGDFEDEVPYNIKDIGTSKVCQSMYADEENTENTDTNQLTRPIPSSGPSEKGGKLARKPKSTCKKKCHKRCNDIQNKNEIDITTDDSSPTDPCLLTGNSKDDLNVSTPADIQDCSVISQSQLADVESEKHQDPVCEFQTAPAFGEFNISDLENALGTVILSGKDEKILSDEFSDLELPFCEEENQKDEQNSRKESRRSKRRSSDFYVMQPTYSVEEELSEIDMIDSVEEVDTCRKSKRLKRKSIEIFRQSRTPSKDDLDDDCLGPIGDSSDNEVDMISGDISKICSQNELDSKGSSPKESTDILVDSEIKLDDASTKSCPGKQARKRKSSEPSVEEIYLNKNFSMPRAKVWETIFENPLKNKSGREIMTSLKKIRRSIQFSEFVAPPSKMKLRRKKATNLGWKPPTKKSMEKTEKLLESKLAALDASLQRSPYNQTVDTVSPAQQEDYSSIDCDEECELIGLDNSSSSLRDKLFVNDKNRSDPIESIGEEEEPSTSESDMEDDDTGLSGQDYLISDKKDDMIRTLIECSDSIRPNTESTNSSAVHENTLSFEEVSADNMLAKETFGTSSTHSDVGNSEQDQDDVFFTPMKWAPGTTDWKLSTNKSVVSSVSETDTTFRTCPSTDTDFEVFRTPNTESQCNDESGKPDEQSDNNSPSDEDTDSLDSSTCYNLDSSNNSLNTAMMMLLNSSKETSFEESDISQSTLSSLNSSKDVFSMSGVGEALFSDEGEEDNSQQDERLANSSSFSDYESTAEMHRSSLRLDVPPPVSKEKKMACILARSLQLYSYRIQEQSENNVSVDSTSAQHVHWSDRPVQIILYDENIHCSSLDDTLPFTNYKS